MIDLKLLEKEPELIIQKLRRRGPLPQLDGILNVLKQRKLLIAELQSMQEHRNAESDALGRATKDEIEKKRATLRELSQSIKSKEAVLLELESKLEHDLLVTPNIPRDDVPTGKSADDNVEVKRVGEPRVFSFEPLHHLDIGEKTGTVDMVRAAKVSGSRFAFLCGVGAKLNRALLQYMTDFHVAKGDTELTPPYLVRPETLLGVGQLPKFKEDVFEVLRTNADPLYLIPTAEAPVTYYFADEILEEENLPVRLCAYSACFRSEAGSAGRDTRGLIRVHQFEKVEMVRFATPEQSNDELEAMVDRAGEILSSLELPYRVMTLCTGDISASSEKTYDLEVWLPAQNCYREISSCSAFGTYQARRSKIRYRKTAKPGEKSPKPEHVVTLNGSGLPLGRTLVAILENHQQADGSVNIPKVLWPYMSGTTTIPAPN